MRGAAGRVECRPDQGLASAPGPAVMSKCLSAPEGVWSADLLLICCLCAFPYRDLLLCSAVLFCCSVVLFCCSAVLICCSVVLICGSAVLICCSVDVIYLSEIHLGCCCNQRQPANGKWQPVTWRHWQWWLWHPILKVPAASKLRCSHKAMRKCFVYNHTKC